MWRHRIPRISTEASEVEKGGRNGWGGEKKKRSVPRQENNSVKGGGDSTGRAARCVALHTRWHSAHSASTSGCTSDQEIPGIRTAALIMGLCNQQLCRRLLQVPGRKEVRQQSNGVASTQAAHPVTLVASLQGVLWCLPSLGALAGSFCSWARLKGAADAQWGLLKKPRCPLSPLS